MFKNENNHSLFDDIMATREALTLVKIQSPIGELAIVKGVSRDFLGLREDAVRLGGRPLTTIELDTAVMHEPTRLQLRENAVWYRSGSIAVYRASGQEFKAGEEIVDPYTDSAGRRFVLLAEAIPKEAVGRSGVIFIAKPMVTMHLDRVQISAPEGTGLFVPNAVRNSGDKGILHPETGLVVKGRGSNDQTRWFYKTDEDRVVPVHRDAGNFFNDRRGVIAVNRPQLESGVVVLLNQAQAGREAAALQDGVLVPTQTFATGQIAFEKIAPTVHPDIAEALGAVFRTSVQ